MTAESNKMVRILTDKQLGDLAKQASKMKVPHSHEGLTIQTYEVIPWKDKVIIREC